MKHQFGNSPTREAMIEEFGADPSRLFKAEEDIRRFALDVDRIAHDKEHYATREVARILIACGLAEAFALYCTRLGGDRGRLSILFGEVAEFWPSGVLTVSAEFDASGGLKGMTGEVDCAEPFGLCCDGLLAGCDPNGNLKNTEWLEGMREEVYAYGSARSLDKKSPTLLTVVRFPLSRAQSYRKFIDERWYDPDVATPERLESPLDRAVFERFEILADSVKERFNAALAAAEDHPSDGNQRTEDFSGGERKLP